MSDGRAYAAKIDANYKLSAFKAIYESGSSFFNFCKDEYDRPQTERGAKFFFAQASNVKNQFGLTATYMLTKIWGRPTQTRTNILLDQNYRMLEITFLNFNKDDSQAIQYGIHTLDGSGNYYMNDYYGPADTGNAHYITHQKYISADGLYAFQQDLNPRRSDRGTGKVLSKFYTVANGKTWDDFFIVLSHAWSGGFYGYGGKVQSDYSKAYSSLYITTVDGNEVCADGSSSTLNNWTRYPSPTAPYGYCMNNW